MTSYVPEYLKSKNRKLIFDLFVRHKELSRAEIVQLTQMSFPTASKAVDFLLSRNIIQEVDVCTGNEDRPGRKRQGLRFNPLAYSALSLNFEGQLVEIGLIDLAGNLLHYETLEFNCFEIGDSYDALGRYLNQMLKKRTAAPVLGLGIGFPADVNSVTGEISLYDKRGNFLAESLHARLAGMQNHLGLSMFVENDVNLASKGEIFSRVSDEICDNLCYLTLGSGFGAGIVLNGRIWLGDHCRAGEIGNTQAAAIDPDQPIEPQMEPLENSINVEAIERRFGINILEDPSLDEAQKKEIIRFLLPNLATAIYNFSFSMDIDQFILSGFIPQKLGPGLLERTEDIVNQMLYSRKRSIALSPPSSGHNTLIGAASLVFDNTILNELQGKADR